MDELKGVAAYIARDNPKAARKLAAKIRVAGRKLGVRNTGRKGRVTGTHEKSVSGLPYVIAYAIESVGGQESIVILRVIHASRDWSGESWPAG